MAYLISAHQTADSSFRTLPGRPPIESSVFSSTALSLRALQFYGKDPQEKIRKAAEWLQTAKPRTGEDRSMQLLGLAWAKSKTETLQRFAKALIAEQQQDG